MNTNANRMANAAEEAFLYDLSVAPQWREVFNQILDEVVLTPSSGTVLDAGCGTGDYALGVATFLGSKGSVLGIDPSEARLSIARAKASLKKLENVTFQNGAPTATGVPDRDFDLVVGDLTMVPSREIAVALAELRAAARPSATVGILTPTRGSFDEFYSIYWEALYEAELLGYAPRLEELVTERPTIGEIESLAKDAGLRRIRSVTRQQRFDYPDGASFLSTPLIANYFLPGWLALVPEDGERERLLVALANLIDRARDGIDFDVSIKATVIIGVR